MIFGKYRINDFIDYINSYRHGNFRVADKVEVYVETFAILVALLRQGVEPYVTSIARSPPVSRTSAPPSLVTCKKGNDKNFAFIFFWTL